MAGSGPLFARPLQTDRESGAPERSRTPNLLIRSQALYPIELRAHMPVTARAEGRELQDCVKGGAVEPVSQVSHVGPRARFLG